MPPQPISGFFSRAAARYGLVLACFALLSLTAWKAARIETDFSAFLPPSATPQQKLLIAQLRDGLVSRLMLISLEGSDEARLAQASRALAARLANEPGFDYAANGSLDQFMAQGEVLMRERYALSPEVAAQKFTVAGLRAALEEQLAQLASPMGVLTRATMARDPTGEFLATLRGLDTGAAPALRQGVWFSADGRRAFLLAQTHAAGFDSERQAEAVAAVQRLAAEIAKGVAPEIKLTLTGPGVFAAESRRVIERDARVLSLASALFILAMLVFVYRSALPIALVLTPVAFGLLIGVLLVQLLFGSVHALTLAFAATLLGEAVDYPNYLLLNTAAGETARGAARRIARTLALAVLTTVASAMALTLSGFRGLAQLGVLTMAGVLVAGAVTHGVLPWLLGDQAPAFRRLRIPPPPRALRTRWLAVVALAATLAGVLGLAWTHPAWWEQDLAGLSPASARMREIDANLRREMGAPEVSVFLASRGASEAAALLAAENARAALLEWKRNKWIRNFDTPTAYLPSPATQAARRAALPGNTALQTNLRQALRGLPFRDDVFQPFLRDVAAARDQPPVTRATYAGTPLGAKLNALVVELDGEWLVLTPLGGVADAANLISALAARPDMHSELVDLKQLSSQMLEGYRYEALRQAGWGVLLILALLLAGLRSPGRALRVAAPAIAALVLTAALLAAGGQKLSVFHLVALLLVLGIGLNYALFFERPPADAEDAARTRLSLAVCGISTIATFGLLAWSSTPVLHAIGSTVALGAVLSLLLAALWTGSEKMAAR